MTSVRVDVVEGGVGLLLLDRPDRLNALSSATASALRAGVARLAGDQQVRAFVVAGEGRAFCAGADITELEGLAGPHDFRAFISGLTDAFDAVAACPKPSVAAVHGVAFGGGCELALACDLRIAEDTARIGVPEIKLGLLPGAAGTARLSRLLPQAVAKQLLMTGDPLTAAEAHRLGLVNELTGAGQARDAAVALARRLAALPPLALAAAKMLVDTGGGLPFAAAVALERETVSMLFGTADSAEGLRAFVEKRPPRFRGT